MATADPTCDPLDLACATSTWSPDGSSTALDQLAGAVREALGTTLAALGRMWTDVATPVLTGSGGGAVDVGEVDPASLEAVETVLSWVVWLGLGLAVMSLLALGAWLAVAGRRGDGERHLGRIGIVLSGVILISAAAAIVGALVPAERFASGGSAPVATTQNALWWFTAGMAVLSVIVAGTKMAWEQRAAPAKDLVRSLLTLVVVAGAGLTVIALAVVAADSFALWLLRRVTGGVDLGPQVTAMVPLDDSLGVLLVIVLGLLAVLAGAVQIMLLVLRGAMLVILAGIFPLSASFTNTTVGRAWFTRVVSWVIAFVLYKPAAAIVYATAVQLTGQDLFTDDGTGLVPLLAGIVLMVLALLALPALMAVAAPLVGTVVPVAPVSSSAPAGTTATMPTGAVPVQRLRPAAAPTGASALPGSARGSVLVRQVAAPTGPVGSVGPGGAAGTQAPRGAAGHDEDLRAQRPPDPAEPGERTEGPQDGPAERGPETAPAAGGRGSEGGGP